jgi:hypothetical protein
MAIWTNKTKQCITNCVFVIKSFKMPNFTNVELTDMVLAVGAVDGNAAGTTGNSFRTAFYLIQKRCNN